MDFHPNGTPFNLGTRRFPCSAMPMLLDADISPYFQRFLTDTHCQQNANFLLALHQDRSPEYLIETFIALNSPQQLNISGIQRQDAIDSRLPPEQRANPVPIEDDWSSLGSVGEDLDPADLPDWDTVIGNIRGEIITLLDRGPVSNFFESSQFEAFCFSIIGPPGDRAKGLGVTDAAGQKLVGELMIATALKDQRLIEVAGKALMRKQGWAMSLPDLVAAVRAGGFANTQQADEDLPPPPPDYDEDDDLPPPPPLIGDVSQYKEHLRAIVAARKAGNKDLIHKSARLLIKTMVRRNDCHPDTTLEEIMGAVNTHLGVHPLLDAPFPDGDAKNPTAAPPEPFPDDAGPTEATKARIQAFLAKEIKTVARFLSSDKRDKAEARATQLSKTLSRTDTAFATMTPAKILTTAAKQNRAANDPEVAHQTKPELTTVQAANTNWAQFGKVYKLSEADADTCRDIAVAVVKSGEVGGVALASAKDLVARQKKDKAAKFKFKNARHVVDASMQAVHFKATRQKLDKPLKPVADPDDI